MQRQGEPEVYVGRKWSDFANLHKRIRLELPGKVLPPLPRRNKKNSLFSPNADYVDDDVSLSSVSTQETTGLGHGVDNGNEASGGGGGFRSYLPIPGGHRRSASRASVGSSSSRRASGEESRVREKVVLYREEQRVSLRAFLRTFLKYEQIANSKAMAEFLSKDPVSLNEEEMEDIERRKAMDEKRVEEQRKFYEIARQRAAELDVHMEKFRREIVEASALFASLALDIMLTRLQMGFRTSSKKSGSRTRSPSSNPSTKSLPNGVASRLLPPSIISS